MTTIKVPERLPLALLHTIDIMRCQVCGEIVPGDWIVSRETKRAGVDHILDDHRADLIAGRLRPPLFRNCDIPDPFWDDEHVPKTENPR